MGGEGRWSCSAFRRNLHLLRRSAEFDRATSLGALRGPGPRLGRTNEIRNLYRGGGGHALSNPPRIMSSCRFVLDGQTVNGVIIIMTYGAAAPVVALSERILPAA